MKARLGLLALAIVLRVGTLTAETATLRQPLGPQLVEGWPVILGNAMRFPLAVADVDGDGRDEIAVGVRDGRIYLLDGNGRPLPGWPREADSWIYQGPLVDDVNGDGRLEVVAATFNGSVYQWRIDGSAVAGWPRALQGIPTSSPRLVRLGRGGGRLILLSTAPNKVHLLEIDGSDRPGWPKSIAHITRTYPYDSRCTAQSDLDGDGADEILHLSSRDAVLYAWRADGTDYPGFPRWIGDEPGFGLGLDRPSLPRLIACTTHSRLLAFGADGQLRYEWSPPDTNDMFVSSPFFLSLGDSTGQTDLICATTVKGLVYLWDRDGRLQPGWPVRLGGFIYGVPEATMSHVVFGSPLVEDADGDGAPEIIIGCYDHHLYCFELDGRLVPGWPETVEDAVSGTIALAQLDGAGARELVVGQIGETIFAYRLGVSAPRRTEISSARWNASTEWPPAYFAAAGALAVLVLLLVRQLRAERRRAGAFAADRWTRRAFALVLAVLAAWGAFLLADIARYTATKHRLAAAEVKARRALESERLSVGRTAEELAARLDSSIVRQTASPLGLLAPLERLADHYRFEYRFKGLLVTDPSGASIIGIGLARGWTDLEDLGVAKEGMTQPLLVGETPVFVVESARRIHRGPDSLRFFVLSSLLGSVPDAIADSTGFSTYIRLGDATLAWGGAGLLTAPGMRPGLDRTQPSRDIPIGNASAKPRMTVRLAMERFERSSSGWMDFIVVLLGPFLYLFLSVRRGVFRRVPLEWWWIPLFVGAYAAGFSILRAGASEAGYVSLSGRSLEALLHMAGALGVAVAARNIVASRRSKRLDVALFGSYLLVGLIPLAAIMFIVADLVRDLQYRIVQSSILELADRADHLAIAYPGKYDFPRYLDEQAPGLLEKPPETGYLNFVMENHLLFTYDLPTAFITLWATDRRDPERYFTGFSYRAPRVDKLYSKMPGWMHGQNQKGLFLDDGVPVIRAIRTFRTQGIETRIAGNIPLDAETATIIEKRLRVLRILPYVRLEPAWPKRSGEHGFEAGWYVPFSTDLILRAADWHTGAPRWIAYRARAYLPRGPEKWPILASFGLLLLLPLGLSAWGAYATYQRTVQPLTRLLVGIRRVEQGDMEYRLWDTGESQIALAAQSFDKMAESLGGKIAELAEKKKVEEVSALKSRFISMISHDLKTPLASIRGATENILEELAGPVSERQRAYLEMILKSSDNLQRMISDILDLSRIESGRLILNIETLNAALEMEHILRSVQPLLDGKSLEARISAGVKNTNVAADRTRLWQIVNNILSNAIRHSPQGGIIDISIEEAPARDRGSRPMLEIAIADQGPGITPEEEAHLFEPFHARASEAPGEHGIGLGLTIVKQLVELHGGAVSHERSALGGARFVFTLPAAKQPR